MGLFDKKHCNICGEKVGLLDKKLADGFVCKQCRKKLSPFFEVEKTTTEQQIREQMSAREENRCKLEAFQVTQIYGASSYLLIDDENKQFAVITDTSEGLFKSGKPITCLEDALPFNPDIIRFDQVENVNIQLTCNPREEKKTEDGKQVSYSPKHYTYLCGFALNIAVKDHPYVSYIRLALDDGNVQVYTECPRQEVDLGRKLAADLLHMPSLDPQKVAACYGTNSLKDIFLHNPYEMPDYVYGFKTNLRNKDALKKYSYYMAVSKKIKEILTEE